MKDIDKKIIQALADNNLSVDKTAKEVFMGRSSIYRHVRKIKKETGLNPLSFWDLLNLLKMCWG